MSEHGGGTLHQLVTLGGLRAPDRFDFWWQSVATAVVPVQATSEHTADFWAELASADLGPLRLSRARCSSFEARRTPVMIRRSDPELYQLSLSLRGRSGLHQLRREASLGPGDFVLYDTSRVFRAWTCATPTRVTASGVPRGGVSDGIILQIPRQVLPFRANQIETVLSTRMSSGDGIGGILAAVLRKTAGQRAPFAVTEAAQVGAAIVDLLVGMIAHQLGEDQQVTSDEGGRALLLRIQLFVERHLADPELSPAGLAAAHHISLSYLQKLFRRHDATVAGWIRQRRLERCRRDLADPALAHRPVQTVAMTWGFSAAAHFSRAFREAYGVPPAAWRHAALNGELSAAGQGPVRAQATTPIS